MSPYCVVFVCKCVGCVQKYTFQHKCNPLCVGKMRDASLHRTMLRENAFVASYSVPIFPTILLSIILCRCCVLFFWFSNIIWSFNSRSHKTITQSKQAQRSTPPTNKPVSLSHLSWVVLLASAIYIAFKYLTTHVCILCTVYLLCWRRVDRLSTQTWHPPPPFHCIRLINICIYKHICIYTRTRKRIVNSWPPPPLLLLLHFAFRRALRVRRLCVCVWVRTRAYTRYPKNTAYQ